MFLTLQIVFTVLSALCVAAVIPVGALVGWAWAGACGLIALLFFGLTLLCKQSNAQREEKDKREESDQSERE